MTDFLISAFVTFFVIIDPLGMVPIYVSLTRGMSAPHRRRVAMRSIAIAAVTLLVFAVGGGLALGYLGVTLPAFRIAGGALLFLLSIDMLFARQSGIRSTTADEEKEAEARSDVAVFPLAIPLIAGPGAITSTLLLLGQTEGDPLLAALVIALILFVLLLTLASFLFASRLMGWLGVTGVNVIGRVLGIILAALAVQYIIDGVRAVILD